MLKRLLNKLFPDSKPAQKDESREKLEWVLKNADPRIWKDWQEYNDYCISGETLMYILATEVDCAWKFSPQQETVEKEGRLVRAMNSAMLGKTNYKIKGGNQP